MKASKAYKQDKFNVMRWKWVASDEVVISLVDNNTGKSGKFKVKIKDDKIDQILEDEEMR